MKIKNFIKNRNFYENRFFFQKSENLTINLIAPVTFEKNG